MLLLDWDALSRFVVACPPSPLFPACPPQKQQKEFIIRCIYVEMLGHDASFGYMEAVQV